MEQIRAEMTANVWKVVAKPGDQIGPDDVIAILESMKMEIPIVAEAEGTIKEIVVREGDTVQEGDPIATIE